MLLPTYRPIDQGKRISSLNNTLTMMPDLKQQRTFTHQPESVYVPVSVSM